MNTEKQKLINAIENFKDAALRLNELWIGSEFDLSTDYPFSQSFDELTFDIAKWKKTAIEEITNTSPQSV